MSIIPVEYADLIKPAPWYKPDRVNGVGHLLPTQQAIHMSHAFLWRECVTCIRGRAGCVITVLEDGVESCVSHGFNGGGVGMDDNGCRHEGKVPGECGHLHSEQNATIRCYTRGDKNVYITDIPCLDRCSKSLVNIRGVRKIYIGAFTYRSGREAFEYLYRAGIELFGLVPPDGWMGGLCTGISTGSVGT